MTSRKRETDSDTIIYMYIYCQMIKRRAESGRERSDLSLSALLTSQPLRLKYKKISRRGDETDGDEREKDEKEEQREKKRSRGTDDFIVIRVRTRRSRRLEQPYSETYLKSRHAEEGT